MAKKQFGSVRKLPSGRWQARYTDHTGTTRTARTADDRPLTFTAKADAQAWLKAREKEEFRLSLLAPAPEAEPVPDVPTLRSYATAWVPARRSRKGTPLTPATRAHYTHLLTKHVLPSLGDLELSAIDRTTVRAWFADLEKTTGPTACAHSYALLRTILRTAVEDELIESNPAQIRGAGRTDRVREIVVPTVDQVAALAAAVPERFRAMILLAAWCGLRFGEVSALQRGDIDIKAGVVKVRRGQTRAAGATHVGAPKSAAGVRDVPVPPHVRAAVRDHLKRHTGPEADALLFPAAMGGIMLRSAAGRWYDPARLSLGLARLRFHDLRHFCGTYLARAGANTKESMTLLGHSTPAMSLRYQHMINGRGQDLAAKLSELAGHAPEPETAPAPKRRARGKRAALQAV
jgi:integrase